ncbi:antibiotic biosynthesis monooxygenase family protein [Paracoccaceae bacterium GXU_MW_L88]
MALPEPPYYAVIFSSDLSPDDAGYDKMAEEMAALAAAQPGYLGMESVRGSDRFGITVSYWRSEADIAAWKAVMRHRAAQKTGQARWYRHYTLRVAKVERQYEGPEGRDAP